MSFVRAGTDLIASAAADLEGIGQAIGAASAAASAPTSGLLAAAADEVSGAIADLFGAYGREYQAVVGQAAAYQGNFTQALAAASQAYATAETAAGSALRSALVSVFGEPGAPALLTATPLPPFAPNPVSIIMGGTGVPIPTPKVISGALDLFIRPSVAFPTAPFPLNTPEQLYPLTGVRSLTLDASVSQGLTILHDAIMQQTAGGGKITVFGISQSAVISSLEMRNLAAMGPLAPAFDQLNFVLTGNEMNPNGGMLARFPNLSLASLGLTFYGATPSDTIYPTAIYSLEYDGFADFPRYPLNILADLNAVLGIVYVHPTYFDLTTAQVDSAIKLPTSPGYTGVTDYYIIPTEHLPLLEPLRAVPYIGNPLANLLEPTTRALVNLGYGDPRYGYSTSPADVWTPFGLFPEVHPVTLADALSGGTQQGISNFSRDITALVTQQPEPLIFDTPTPTQIVTTLTAPPNPQGFANTIASIISTNYSVLLPTADTALSLLTTIPAYNAQLFAEQLAQGNLINAIGYPIAADFGLATVAGAVEFLVIAGAAIDTIKDIQSLLP